MVELDKIGHVSIDRIVIFRWLSGFFARELETSTLDFYSTAQGEAFLAVLAANPALRPLVSALQDLSGDKDQVASNLLDLRSAYARLFLGGGGLRSAPPYHSAYASGTGLLYQAQMVEMAELLKELDLSIVTSLKEPPDHIAIQLSVLAELADRAAHHASTDYHQVQRQAKLQQIAFMDRHILSWLPAFRDDCAAHDSSRFYGLAASATLEYLQQDRQRLDPIEG